MNVYNKIIRIHLSKMAPIKAIDLINSFQLPQEEALCIIEKEIKKRSVVQIATDLNLSPETVKRRRSAGLNKIYQSLRW